ncbi:DnaJ domain-containing protein [Sphingomonas sp. PAMC 26621]|uniref:DnaJ domain-containing protein n=1 Tax=Sphingomonas sp. PAMC 26621 TaxID=1112213 RepID=UPI0014787C88|nr:DnaJ domain-containing protein [Sphingomonas sp. PAMC 26621]
MDRSGYYAALGLNHTASADEIRAAFRHLEKRSHPDVNSKTDGGDNFRKISEAYNVLRDFQKRAHYDRQNVNVEQNFDKNSENPKPNAKSLKPSKCEVCCQITAQPRHITFWKVSSFILVTKRTPIQKVFCYSCAEKESLRACLYTAALGW